jgi:hypothetical protein
MLTGLIGNGLAVLVAGVAILLSRVRHHVPGGAMVGEVLLTMAVLGMLFAGELARGTGLGAGIVSVITTAEGWLGPGAKTILALATFATVLAVGVAVFRTATERAMTLAFVLPFGLAMFQSGLFHSLDGELLAPAQAIAAQIAAGLGV